MFLWCEVGKMLPIKELINKVRFDPSEDPDEYVLVFRDFDNEREIRFSDVEGLEGNFMIIDGSSIPLHRIKRVLKKGEVIWERS